MARNQVFSRTVDGDKIWIDVGTRPDSDSDSSTEEPYRFDVNKDKAEYHVFKNGDNLYLAIKDKTIHRHNYIEFTLDINSRKRTPVVSKNNCVINYTSSGWCIYNIPDLSTDGIKEGPSVVDLVVGDTICYEAGIIVEDRESHYTIETSVDLSKTDERDIKVVFNGVEDDYDGKRSSGTNALLTTKPKGDFISLEDWLGNQNISRPPLPPMPFPHKSDSYQVKFDDKHKTDLMTEQDKTKYQLEDLHMGRHLTEQELENPEKQMTLQKTLQKTRQDVDSKPMLKSMEACFKTLTLDEEVKQKGRMPEDGYKKIQANFCYLLDHIEEPLKLNNKLFEKNVFDADQRREIEIIFRYAEYAASDKLVTFVLNCGDAYGNFIQCLREMGYTEIVNVLETTTKDKIPGEERYLSRSMFKMSRYPVKQKGRMPEDGYKKIQANFCYLVDHIEEPLKLNNKLFEKNVFDADQRREIEIIFRYAENGQYAASDKLVTFVLNCGDAYGNFIQCLREMGYTEIVNVLETTTKGKNKTNLMTEQDKIRHQLEDLHKDRDLTKQELENLKKQMETLKTRRDVESKKMLKKIEKKVHELEIYKKQTDEKTNSDKDDNG